MVSGVRTQGSEAQGRVKLVLLVELVDLYRINETNETAATPISNLTPEH